MIWRIIQFLSKGLLEGIRLAGVRRDAVILWSRFFFAINKILLITRWITPNPILSRRLFNFANLTPGSNGDLTVDEVSNVAYRASRMT